MRSSRLGVVSWVLAVAATMGLVVACDADDDSVPEEPRSSGGGSSSVPGASDGDSVRLSTSHATSAIRSIALTSRGAGVVSVRRDMPSTYPDLWIVSADGSTMHLRGEGVAPAARLVIEWEGYSLGIDDATRVATLTRPDGTIRTAPIPSPDTVRQGMTMEEIGRLDEYLEAEIKSIIAVEDLHLLYEPFRRVIFESGIDKAPERFVQKLEQLNQAAKELRRDLFADEPIGAPPEAKPDAEKAREVVVEFQDRIEGKQPLKRQLPEKVDRVDDRGRSEKADYDPAADVCPPGTAGQRVAACGQICCQTGEVCLPDAAGEPQCAQLCTRSSACPSDKGCCERQPSGAGVCKAQGSSAQQCMCNSVAECASGACGVIPDPQGGSPLAFVCKPNDGAPNNGCNEGVTCATDHCCVDISINESPAGGLCQKACSSDAECGAGLTCGRNTSGTCYGKPGTCG